MIKELMVCSQKVAESLNPDPNDSWGIISISGGRMSVALKPGWCSVLEVHFNDIVRPIRGFVLFHEDFARDIIDWVEDNYVRGSLEKLAIHCEQGVSRSQAVGLFIQEHYATNLPALKNASRFNRRVYNILTDVYLQSYIDTN